MEFSCSRISQVRFPHILVEAGKQGRIYVVNRDQMTTGNSHYCSGCANDPEIIEESSTVGGMFNMPAYWNNTLYFWGTNDVLKSIPVTNGLPDFTHVTGSTPQLGFPWRWPINLVERDEQPERAIVWAINATQYGSPGPGLGPAVLYAYDATNIPTMLYSSGQNPTRDGAGNAVKFAVPTVANGKVYVGTSTAVDVYGLMPAISNLSSSFVRAGRKSGDDYGGELRTHARLKYANLQREGSYNHKLEPDKHCDIGARGGDERGM